MMQSASSIMEREFSVKFSTECCAFCLKISEWQGKPNLNVLFNYNMPIRGYAKNDGGVFVTMEMAEALTEMANGHRIRGTAHLIKAAVKRD